MWEGQAWHAVSANGLPAGAMYGVPYAFNDGTGESLFWGSQTGEYRLNGSVWSPVPTQLTNALMYGGRWSLDLGSGNVVFGMRTGHVFARWNGAAWTPIGTASNGGVVAAATLPRAGGADLYVIGDFDAINGVICSGFARWNGSEWSRASAQPVLEGDGAKVIVTAKFRDHHGAALYTNSTPQSQFGETVQGLYKYDGDSLTLLGATDNGPVFPLIMCMEVFDDGRGPALYIGGAFRSIGGVAAHNLARWDGTHFEQVGGGVESIVMRMGVVREQRGFGLWVQTDLNPTIIQVGGGSVNGLALWVGCRESNCYSNCDLSATAPTLNVNDFMCFIDAYARRDPFADCTTDGAQNVADFTCFMNKFAVGCP